MTCKKPSKSTKQLRFWPPACCLECWPHVPKNQQNDPGCCYEVKMRAKLQWLLRRLEALALPHTASHSRKVTLCGTGSVLQRNKTSKTREVYVQRGLCKRFQMSFTLSVQNLVFGSVLQGRGLHTCLTPKSFIHFLGPNDFPILFLCDFLFQSFALGSSSIAGVTADLRSHDLHIRAHHLKGRRFHAELVRYKSWKGLCQIKYWSRVGGKKWIVNGRLRLDGKSFQSPNARNCQNIPVQTLFVFDEPLGFCDLLGSSTPMSRSVQFVCTQIFHRQGHFAFSSLISSMSCVWEHWTNQSCQTQSIACQSLQEAQLSLKNVYNQSLIDWATACKWNMFLNNLVESCVDDTSAGFITSALTSDFALQRLKKPIPVEFAKDSCLSCTMQQGGSLQQSDLLWTTSFVVNFDIFDKWSGWLSSKLPWNPPSCTSWQEKSLSYNRNFSRP